MEEDERWILTHAGLNAVLTESQQQAGLHIEDYEDCVCLMRDEEVLARFSHGATTSALWGEASKYE